MTTAYGYSSTDFSKMGFGRGSVILGQEVAGPKKKKEDCSKYESGSVGFKRCIKKNVEIDQEEKLAKMDETTDTDGKPDECGDPKNSVCCSLPRRKILGCLRNNARQPGGSNKKRKTKMQKKKKNCRTRRKMSKKKIGGAYPRDSKVIDEILNKDPDCDTFEVYRTNGTRVTTRSRFDLTRAEDKATFRANIIDNHYGLTPIC